MEISQKDLDEYKRLHRERFGEDITDAEARESAGRLLGLMEILFDAAVEEQRRLKRLEKEPKGFHLLDGKHYNCLICHRLITDHETWWTKEGTKCLDCQLAIDKRIIPKSVCKNRDSWYASWQLTHEFELHSSTIGKMIREGTLKPREIKTESGTLHERIFLKKDNPWLAKRDASRKTLKVEFQNPKPKQKTK